MKPLRIVLILLTFFLSLVTHGQSNSGSEESYDFSRYINLIPGKNLRDSVKEYLKLIGVEKYKGGGVGFQNKGVVEFNWGLLKSNKCFQTLTADFYSKIVKHAAHYSRNFKPRQNNLFNNLAASTENGSKKEGWLWRLALGHAGGRPNLAMTLIGICGHDNTDQLPKRSNCVRKSAAGGGFSEICTNDSLFIPFSNQSQRSDYEKYSKEIFTNVDKNWQPETAWGLLKKGSLPANFAYRISGVEGENQGLMCPLSWDPMYLQGALGKETLLDKKLISEIGSIQAPTAGLGQLPSKYYHVMMSAYATCSLVRGGMPGVLAKKIQSTLINTYRMRRTCEVIKRWREPIITNKKKTLKDLVTFVFSELKGKTSTCSGTDIYGDDTEGRASKMPDCELLKPLFRLSRGSDITDEILQKKILNVISSRDASLLFRRKVLGRQKCRKIQFNKGRITTMAIASDSKLFCDGLAKKRCEAARRKLKTWWVDFKWSESQHLKGAEFAIKNCQPEEEFFKKGLEQQSCDSLKDRSGHIKSKKDDAVR